jgi:hypothetical protein
LQRVKKHPGKCQKMASEEDLARMFENVYNTSNKHPMPLAYNVKTLSSETVWLSPSVTKHLSKLAAKKAKGGDQ